MENGYYWATQKTTKDRQIVQVTYDTVYVTGNDISFELEEFEHFVTVPDEGGGE